MIAARAVKLAHLEGIDYDQICCEMDLTAAHANGCRLDLERLLASPDRDFGHDVFGIRRFLDRRTGKIAPEVFDPRCSMGEARAKHAKDAKKAMQRKEVAA